jgi:hypothetical protein
MWRTLECLGGFTLIAFPAANSTALGEAGGHVPPPPLDSRSALSRALKVSTTHA